MGQSKKKRKNGSFVGFPPFFKTKCQYERSKKFACYPVAFLFCYLRAFLIHFTAVTVIIFIRISRGLIVKHSARGERIEQASDNVQLIKN